MKRVLVWLIVIGVALVGGAYLHFKSTVERVLDEDETFTRRPIRVEMDESHRDIAYVSMLCYKANEGRAPLREELKRSLWPTSRLRDLTLQLFDSEEKLCQIKGEMYDSMVKAGDMSATNGANIQAVLSQYVKTVELSREYRKLFPETAALEAQVVAAGGVRRAILEQAQEHNLAQAGRIEGWQKQAFHQYWDELPPYVQQDMTVPDYMLTP